MKLADIFNKQFGAAFLVIMGGLLAISPAGLQQANQLTPKELAATITSNTAFVSVEEVAAWLIDKRPDLILVDIRSSEEYSQYHIPEAQNIPIAVLFEEESLEQLNDDYTIVLYSNGNTYAAQAWVMLRHMGIENYVMMGGLNYWTNAILNPEVPNDLAADDEILQYQFRKAASGYFTGGGIAVDRQAETSQPKPKPKPKKRVRKKGGEEGC